MAAQAHRCVEVAAAINQLEGHTTIEGLFEAGGEVGNRSTASPLSKASVASLGDDFAEVLAMDCGCAKDRAVHTLCRRAAGAQALYRVQTSRRRTSCVPCADEPPAYKLRTECDGDAAIRPLAAKCPTQSLGLQVQACCKPGNAFVETPCKSL